MQISYNGQFFFLKKKHNKKRWPSRKIKIWYRYRVFLKKVLHKREEKMQEKMKMTWQKDENLVHVQQQCSVYFCIKTFFKSWFVWLIWPFECPILMILTSTKYHGNLLRDSPLFLLSIVKLFSSLETKKVLKIANETFLRITRYFRLRMRCTRKYAKILSSLISVVYKYRVILKKVSFDVFGIILVSEEEKNFTI